MKKLLFTSIALLSGILAFSQNAPIKTITGNISKNTTWSNDTIYRLDGFVYVDSLNTLTIEPGTIIRGVQATKGTLIVKRGAKLIANGSKNAPIVFTSDNSVGERNPGDWGGVILLGRARVNLPGGQGVIEGGVNGGFFGGNDDADNSGVLRYVRIEYAGIAFAPNNEINSLTMGGVGSGTTIEYVQATFGGDDSFEWFGGTVNGKYLIAFRGTDDDFDTDFGYRGKVQFAIGQRDPFFADIATGGASNGFESDNDGQGSTNTPKTRPVFSNITLIGPKYADTVTFFNANFKRGNHIKKNSSLSLFNSTIIGYPTGVLFDGTRTEANATGDTMRYKNNLIIGSTKKAFDTVGLRGSSFDINAYMAAGNNTTLPMVSDAKYTNISNLENPNYLLANGSPLATGASFSDSYLADNFFTPTTYRGAFGSEDWTKGWANFNPDTVDYNKLQVIVGINSVKNNIGTVNVYPNPANDFINVAINLNEVSTFNISLVDMMGKEVKSFNITNPTNQQFLTISTNNLIKGFYVVKVTSNNGVSSEKVIIK